MQKYQKVIFLDEDNTRLGPITAVLFQQKLSEADKQDVEVVSRGNVVLFPEPVNQKIVQLSKTFGLDLSEYSAVELSEADFGTDTLILAMDTSCKAMAYEKFANAANIYTFKEYIGSTGDLKLPIGGSVDEYATIIDIISGLLSTLLEKLYSQDEEL